MIRGLSHAWPLHRHAQPPVRRVRQRRWHSRHNSSCVALSDWDRLHDDSLLIAMAVVATVPLIASAAEPYLVRLLQRLAG